LAGSPRILPCSAITLPIITALANIAVAPPTAVLYAAEAQALAPAGEGLLKPRVGWQPSRLLSDRAEAERAFALTEQLGSINAAAQQLGTTWPSLRKAFGRHGLGMPTPNPEAVRQRAVTAARQRTG
jgi:hypothetical protein